ncbi:DUF6843 domain-containing protein [Tenacibaculum sp.]|uniref:DUF6843 domain-containing protein n=1 Tax=Tenacibaculum sp. TaxID=1906242 RepID=UPI003AA9634D
MNLKSLNLNKFFLELLFIFFLGISFSCSKKQEFYYIPEGLNEPFAIIYEIDSGIKRQNIKESKLFKIPSSGILLTQDVATFDTWIKPKRFLVDKEGNLLKEVRDYYIDKYNKVKIEQGSNYIYRSYTKKIKEKNKNQLRFTIFIYGPFESEEKIEELQKKALELENKIIEKFGEDNKS